MNPGAYAETWTPFLSCGTAGLSHTTLWKQLSAHISAAPSGRALSEMCQTKARSTLLKSAHVQLHACA